MPFTIEEAAYHEAGHAVIAHLSSITILENVSITEDGIGGFLGKSETNTKWKIYGKSRAFYEMGVIGAAGFAAHQRYLTDHRIAGDREAIIAGAAGDAQLIFDEFGPGLEGEFQTIAEMRLFTLENWAAVEDLARLLIDSRSITGADAINVIERHSLPTEIQPYSRFKNWLRKYFG